MEVSGNLEHIFKSASINLKGMNNMNTRDFQTVQKVACAGLVLFLMFTNCERSVDNLDKPGFSANPEVFIDGFSSGLEYYPFQGSRLDAFSVENEDTYDNTATSMRFDVPNAGDPAGGYAGAIFRDDNGGRDLTSYNALTFYAKGTKAGTINEIGFGQDFFGNQYAVALGNLKLTTNWEQYTVPIPDASLLTSEQGLLWYSEGPENGDGYSFWLDEVKFENLSGLAQPRPVIMNGNEDTLTSFIGSAASVSGLLFTINQSNGVDVTVNAAPAFYNFNSSDTDIATVNEMGEVSVVGTGIADITASMANISATGTLVIDSQGAFTPAPTPTEDPNNVISIFSNAYDNVPVDFYNGFYEPFQTTTSNDFTVNGNAVLGYDNFNFVGIEFNQNVPTVDGGEMTNFSMDLFFPETVPANSALRIVLVDFGADGSFGGGDDTNISRTITPTTNPGMVSGQWVTVEFSITNLTNRSNLGQIVLDADQGPSFRGESFYVDNIYLYK